MNNVSNLSSTIIPRSDQWNAEQLLNGPLTITVTDVRLGSTEEQPISIFHAHDPARPYKPCKTMRKVLIFAWGENGHDWIGRSMTLYNDPAVKFGGMDVGGIRISHLSDIPKDIKVSLTATKGKKALHEIKVLQAPKKPERPARTERHDIMIADFELMAKEQGFAAYKEAWDRLSKEDKSAIGLGERDRIGALAKDKPNGN